MRHSLIPLSTLLFAASAVAQPAPEADPEEAAIALVVQAMDLQSQSRHEEALVLLENAAAFSSHPKVLFLKARSLFALRRYEEAQATYRTIPAKTDQLELELLEEVRTNLAICEQTLATTTVLFTTPGADGAAVTVDGRAVGASPVSVALRKGTYQVKAVKEGYADAQKVVSIQGEAELTVPLALAPLKNS